jgi:hypothetical protein
MDMCEWKIVTTSDKCAYIVDIHNFDEQNLVSNQCDHPENESRFCSSEKCPIKLEV